MEEFYLAAFRFTVDASGCMHVAMSWGDGWRVIDDVPADIVEGDAWHAAEAWVSQYRVAGE